MLRQHVLSFHRTISPARLGGRFHRFALGLLFGGLIAHTGSGGPAIRFSYQDRIVDALNIIAVRKGFFQQEGLRLKTMRFSSGTACSETLFTGAADLGTLGGTPAVIALARRAPVVLVASHGCGENRHRIVVNPKSGIHAIHDLIGRRIAIKKGTCTYGGFLVFLKAKGIKMSQIHMVDMRPSEMPDALAAGSVDAICASEPTPSLCEVRGAQPLTTLGGLGNTYPVVLLVRKTFLKNHRPEVVRFLRAMMRAEAFMKTHHAEAVKIIAKATGLPEKIAAKAMAIHTYHVNMNQATVRSMKKIGRLLKGLGVIPRLPGIDADVPVARALLRDARAGLKN